MKFIKNKMIVLTLIIVGIVVLACFENKIYAASTDIYDVILFWGQSNMVGSCGKVEGETMGPDPRYKEEGFSIDDFSTKSGIDQEFIQTDVNMNYVKIPLKDKTAYEYNYQKDKVTQITSDTSILGEYLHYNHGTKEIEAVTSGVISVKKSYGTNIIPSFCKAYYENTGHKVIVVFAANGDQKIANFLPTSDKDYGDADYKGLYEIMTQKYKAAINYLTKKECNIGNKFWVCFQGEADVKRSTTEKTYKSTFLKVHNYLKKDLGITKGAIIQSAYTIGSNYENVVNIHKAHTELASENEDIILGSSFPFDRYIPDKDTYNSSDYINNIYTNKNGDKLEWASALKRARLSTGYPYKNTIHFTSAALSQIGKETANIISDSTGPKITVSPSSCTVCKSKTIKFDVSDEGNSGLDTNNKYHYYLSNSNTALSGGKWKKYTSGTEFEIGNEANGTMYLFVKIVKDNAENISTGGNKVTIDNVKYQRFGPYKFDNIGPKLSIKYVLNTPINDSVTVTINANEELQKLSGWKLSSDKKSLSKKYIENIDNQEIMVKDIAGNETKQIVTVIGIEHQEEVDFKVEEEFIKNIKPNMTCKKFKEKISCNIDYEVQEGDIKIKDEELIKTGQVLIVGEKRYILAVEGDTNKDGKADFFDMMYLNKYILDCCSFTIEQSLAGDVNNDGSLDMKDILRINKYRLEKIANLENNLNT